MTDLQRPIRLKSIQREDLIHRHMIGFRNGRERLIRRHCVDDPSARIRGRRDDHAEGRGCGVACGVPARNEQALTGRQRRIAREIVPGLQVVDRDLVGDGNGPERLTGLDHVIDLAVRIGRGDLDRHDQPEAGVGCAPRGAASSE